MESGSPPARGARGYRVNKAGTIYTFAHERRAAMVGVIVGVILAAVVASPAWPDIGVLGKAGVIAIIVVWWVLLCLGKARTGVRVSAGSVAVRNFWRTRTVGIGEIRDITLEPRSNVNGSFWVPRMRLANGDGIWLTGLSCGSAPGPPSSWRLASFDTFQSLVGQVPSQAGPAPDAGADAPAWTKGRRVSPPDGFYADPGGRAGVRYWGGGEWSPLLPADWVKGQAPQFPGTVVAPLPAPDVTWRYAASRARKGGIYTAAWAAGAAGVLILLVGHVASGSRLPYLGLLLAFRAVSTGRAWRQWARLDRASRAEPRCPECGAAAAAEAPACAWCRAPFGGPPPGIPDPAAPVTSDAADGAAPAGADGQAAPEPYPPGRFIPLLRRQE